MFIPQCKATDLKNYKKDLSNKLFDLSIKYDGNYVQIHNTENDGVIIYTSSGKPFKLAILDKLFKNHSPFIYEAEYIGSILNIGKLGNRKYCSTATFRTEYKKGIVSYHTDVRFVVFNKILSNPNPLLNNSIIEPYVVYTPIIKNINIDVAKQYVDEWTKRGYEGGIIRSKDFVYESGKRSKEMFKIKPRATTDLLCIDVELGKGKYTNQIGSLILYDKKKDITVSVGSGLTDEDRVMPSNYYINKTIEISYESIEATYIQPVYIGIKEDE